MKATKTVISSGVQLSQDLLYAIKTERNSEELVAMLANFSNYDLVEELDSEAKKLAFWLNIYNSFVQLQLLKNFKLYSNRKVFFTTRNITIAGEKLSLDHIEHGILRNSKWKYSLGYFGKLVASKFEQQHRLKKVNWRIHFALNCGAKSCPPIAFYTPESIDDQLEFATLSYLEQEVEYDEESNTAHIPALMSWFRADFGGFKGIRKILTTLELIPKNVQPKLQFKPYSWELYLNNYSK